MSQEGRMNELVRRLRDALEPFAKRDIPPSFADHNYVDGRARAGEFRRAQEAHREAASFIEHSAKEVGAVSDEMVERLKKLLRQMESRSGEARYEAGEAIIALFTEASRIPVVVGAVAWECIYPSHGHFTLKAHEAKQAMADGAIVKPLGYLPLATPSSPDVELQAEVERLTNVVATLSDELDIREQEECGYDDEIRMAHSAREAAEARASSAVKALEELLAIDGNTEPLVAQAAWYRARATLQSIRGGEDGR